MIRELDRIAGNEAALEAYRSGIGQIFNSGVIDALRALGRPKRYKSGENQVAMASEAAWSSGWNDCMDALLYFEQLYLRPKGEEMPNIRLDFGSLTEAVERGDLTEEEADAIRRGQTPTYDPRTYTHNIKKPDRP